MCVERCEVDRNVMCLTLISCDTDNDKNTLTKFTDTKIYAREKKTISS